MDRDVLADYSGIRLIRDKERNGETYDTESANEPRILVGERVVLVCAVVTTTSPVRANEYGQSECYLWGSNQYNAKQDAKNDCEEFADPRHLRTESLDSLLHGRVRGDDLLEEATVRAGDTECAHLLINVRVAGALTPPPAAALGTSS